MFIWLYYCNLDRKWLQNYRLSQSPMLSGSRMPLFWMSGNWFSAVWLDCGGGGVKRLRWWRFTFWGKQEATVRSAPPANRARPATLKVVRSKLCWGLKKNVRLCFRLLYSSSGSSQRASKGESVHFSRRARNPRQTLLINLLELSFNVASEDRTPALQFLSHYQHFSVSSCW